MPEKISREKKKEPAIRQISSIVHQRKVGGGCMRGPVDGGELDGKTAATGNRSPHRREGKAATSMQNKQKR